MSAIFRIRNIIRMKFGSQKLLKIARAEYGEKYTDQSTPPEFGGKYTMLTPEIARPEYGEKYTESTLAECGGKYTMLIPEISSGVHTPFSSRFLGTIGHVEPVEGKLTECAEPVEGKVAECAEPVEGKVADLPKAYYYYDLAMVKLLYHLHRKKRIPCQECDEWCMSPSALESHYKERHPEVVAWKGKIQCHQCKAFFWNVEDYKWHKIRKDELRCRCFTGESCNNRRKRFKEEKKWANKEAEQAKKTMGNKK